MYSLAKTAEEFLNDARNSYDGAIPDDVMETYETMRAKEKGIATPAERRHKQMVQRKIIAIDYTAGAISGHMRLGNHNMAAQLVDTIKREISELSELYDQGAK